MSHRERAFALSLSLSLSLSPPAPAASEWRIQVTNVRADGSDTAVLSSVSGPTFMVLRFRLRRPLHPVDHLGDEALGAAQVAQSAALSWMSTGVTGFLARLVGSASQQAQSENRGALWPAPWALGWTGWLSRDGPASIWRRVYPEPLLRAVAPSLSVADKPKASIVIWAPAAARGGGGTC